MTADQNAFRRFVDNYPFSSFEVRAPSHWLDSQQTRHWLTLRAYLQHRSMLGTDTPAILDVGAFPGSLVKSLRLFLGEKGRIDGVGLACPAEFSAELATYDVGYHRINLDPLIGSYPSGTDTGPISPTLAWAGPPTAAGGLGEQGPAPTRLDSPDASYDVVFCTEILEHLLDPFFMLREIRRLLRPGGQLLLTTPNQAVLSHRLRLLLGRSIHPPLRESIMYYLNDWRPHLREYTMVEVGTLLADAGFEVVHQEYMDLSDDDIRLRRQGNLGLKISKRLTRPLMAIPSFRHNMLFLARR